mgnify:CR=1 FL=1
MSGLFFELYRSLIFNNKVEQLLMIVCTVYKNEKNKY